MSLIWVRSSSCCYNHLFIDLSDTIDVSNLNRQFLFRQADVGRTKAETAARFVEKRVKGVKITPFVGKIQDKDEDYYMQFDIVICGLDSVEARRWINAMLVGMFDPDDVGRTLKPLVDGGTEGVANIEVYGSGAMLTMMSRFQRTSSCYPAHYDFMHRMSARYARASSTSSSLHNRHHPASTTALYRVGTSNSMGIRAQRLAVPDSLIESY